MKKSTKSMSYTMPAVIFIAGTILVGLLLAIIQSFGYFPEIGLTQWTMAYYVKIFQDETLLRSFLYSFKTALWSSFIGVAVGFIVSYILVTHKSDLKTFRRFLALPVAIPHIIVVTIVFNLFIKTGFLSRILTMLGWLPSYSNFPNLLFTSSGFGVIMVYFWKAFPYTLMVLYSIVKSVYRRYQPVSFNLGATGYQFFFYVVLPMAKPMIITTTLILFAFSFSAYEVPFLLGATVPKAIPVQAYIEYTSPLLHNRPYAMAINVVMMAIAFVLIGVYDYVSEGIERRRRND